MSGHRESVPSPAIESSSAKERPLVLLADWYNGMNSGLRSAKVINVIKVISRPGSYAR
jgi:hypothetical protein